MDETYTRHLAQAVRRIRQIKSERILLKGHFSKVAKEYGVKVKDLTNAYSTK